MCVFITAGPITKLFAGGGGGEWRTCALRKAEVDRASKQVDVRRLKRNVRARGWQPEPLMGSSEQGRASMIDQKKK